MHAVMGACLFSTKIQFHMHLEIVSNAEKENERHAQIQSVPSFGYFLEVIDKDELQYSDVCLEANIA